MRLSSNVFLLFVIIIITICYSMKQPSARTLNNTDNYYYNANNNQNFYKMANIWPKGLCKTNAKFICNKEFDKIPEDFTIHGLWDVDKSTIRTPSQQKFDLALLKDLPREMYVKWPDVEKYEAKEKSKRASEAFWGHEWTKHGQLDPNFKNRFYDYFKHTLMLFDELDITNIIIKKSGKPTTPESVVEALRRNGRTKPLLVCSNKNKTVYLTEIHFCLDRTATEFVDCVPEPKESSSLDCLPGKPFVYE